jgi:multidrug efflux pump
LPLVFARGPGAGARNSIGIMLVSGMIIGTSFTLFVVPSIYMLIAKDHRRDKLRRGESDLEAETNLEPVLA